MVKKKTEYIPSNIRNKIRMFTPTTFIQLLLEVLATGIRQNKQTKKNRRKKKHINYKGKIKLCLL